MTPAMPRDFVPELLSRLARLQIWAAAAAVVGGIVCVIGAFFWTGQFFRSWLMAWLFILGIALGSMAIEMLHFLTGGQWGVVIRAPLEAASRTLPLMAVLFIPILVGIPYLYPWADASRAASDPLLLHKHPYLNVPFFVIRAVVYFAIWIGCTLLLTRWSRRQSDPRRYRSVRALSAAGLVLYVFTLTFASLDWAQSLNPYWTSTIWGFLFVVGQGLTALAFLICMLVILCDYSPMRELVTRKHLHDLGKLLLMFVMLWAYLSFSQLLIIWAGNLKEEVVWYVDRLKTSWQWVGLALVIFHFFLPFFLLLSRSLKQRARTLFAIAAFLLAVRQLDLFWLTTPAFFRDGFHIHVLDFAAPLAIGGLWLLTFLWLLKKRPLAPVEDPLFLEVVRHAG